MKIGKRTLLAKTCYICGEFKMADQFPLVVKCYRDSYCRKCHNTAPQVQMREHQNATLDGAKKHRKPWTDEDMRQLEALFLEGLSGPAVAHALGRSMYAVYTMKNKLMKETR